MSPRTADNLKIVFANYPMKSAEPHVRCSAINTRQTSQERVIPVLLYNSYIGLYQSSLCQSSFP